MANGHQNWREIQIYIKKGRALESFFLALIDLIDNHLFKVMIAETYWMIITCGKVEQMTTVL